MSNHGLTKENILAALPAALQKDPSVSALAEAVSDALGNRKEEIERIRIYTAIDRLPEDLLDILARDFKVDWWDPNYSLEEKRRTLKDSWQVHRIMGTKKAVESGISAIYPKTEAKPWFEYGGDPYHFKLTIDISKEAGDRTKPQKVLEWLGYYKSLRDTLDVIEYVVNAPEMERPVYAAPALGPAFSITELPKVEPRLPPVSICAAPAALGQIVSLGLPRAWPHFQGAMLFSATALSGGSFSVTRLPPVVRAARMTATSVMGGNLAVTNLPNIEREEN